MHENLGYKVAKIDCTVHTQTCNAYSIRGYPSLIMFKNGEKVDERYSGQRTVDAMNTYALSKK